MRRILAGLTAAVLAGSFFSCAKNAPEPFDVSDRKKDTPVLNEVSSGIEGCYSNGEYVAELLCIEKKDGTCVHNIVLFTAENGEQCFFGTLTGNIEGGETLVAENLEEELSKVAVKVDVKNRTINVCYKYNGNDVPELCGEYTYLNEYRIPEQEDRVFIREGTYYCGEYVMTVSENGKAFRFVITEGISRIVCEGVYTSTEDVRSVSLENNGVPIDITAGLNDEGRLCLNVSSNVENDTCEYTGIYHIAE